MSDPDLDRLAAFVRERRLSLRGMTQAEGASKAGVSDTTWNQVEIGRKVSDRSLAKMSVALDLPAGALRAVLVGHDVEIPTPASGSTTSDSMDFNSRVARLSDADRQTISDLIDRFERDLEEGR